MGTLADWAGSWESTLHRIVLKYVLSFVVLQYILARVAGDRAEKKKDAKGRRLVDRGSVYSIGFASSHRPTTHAGGPRGAPDF